MDKKSCRSPLLKGPLWGKKPDFYSHRSVRSQRSLGEIRRTYDIMDIRSFLFSEAALTLITSCSFLCIIQNSMLPVTSLFHACHLPAEYHDFRCHHQLLWQMTVKP